MDEDYYKILGVARSATNAEVEKAYRRLARKYHPDLNPDDAKAKENFQRVQRAYEVLGNAEKRQLYDRYGSAFETMGAGPQGRGGPGPQGFGDIDIDLGDILGRFGRGGTGGPGGFEHVFRQFGSGGGGRSRRAARRGVDQQAEVTIPFQTSVTGGETRLAFATGDGAETLAVRIPVGIEDGKKIRLRGKGEPGSDGAPNGDLIVTVRVAPHPCYRRKGLDLEVDLPVTLAEAVYGAKVDLPTPAGTISLTIPKGTSSGRRLRIKGQGVKTTDGRQGDLFATVLIQLPPTIQANAQSWIQDFERQYGPSPRANLQW
ncbi:MAG: J domain-containing protein [Planctomycetes bacterium]|nr:J domain-containing protein [Planctomycetota bacterium]